MNPLRQVGAVVAACAICATLANAAGADDATGGSTMSHIGGFDHISTAKFDFNLNSGDFSIPGHFTATRSGTDVTADQAVGNSKSKIMHAQGHVVVHQNRALAGSTTASFTEKPSTLTCDKLDVDGTRKLFTATGNMHFTQEGGREATSDMAVLDDANHHLHMEGHVHVRNGEQTVDANVLDYDTLSGQLDGNGDVTITAPVETAQPGVPKPAGSGKPKKKRIFTLPGT
jgi:lipopolysaccharide assembly outer membrane protein LptD (OstA)